MPIPHTCRMIEIQDEIWASGATNFHVIFSAWHDLGIPYRHLEQKIWVFVGSTNRELLFDVVMEKKNTVNGKTNYIGIAIGVSAVFVLPR